MTICHTILLLYMLIHVEPARPPTNVVAMSTSSSTISVEWQEVTPIDQNGVITMYEVLYEPLETFGGAIGPVTQVVDDQDTSVILTGLQEYVTYSISVRAFTEIGPSVYTAPVLERTDEDGEKFILRTSLI